MQDSKIAYANDLIYKFTSREQRTKWYSYLVITVHISMY